MNRLAIVTNVVGASMILLAIGIIIFGVVQVIDSGDHSCDESLIPSLISIMSRGPYIEISWYNPYPNSKCHVTYILQYTIDNKDKHSLNLTETTYAIPNIEVCSVLEVLLWVVKEDGRVSEEYQLQNYTAFPRSGYISDVQFLPSNEGILVRWHHSLPTDKCRTVYQVTYWSELETLSKQVDSEEVLIPQDTFCSHFQLEITAYIYDVNVSYKLAEYHGDPADLEVQPENIKFEVSGASTAVSWDVPDGIRQCSDLYNVTAKNEYVSEENSYQGTKGCVISLTGFCPSTEFIISPIRLQGGSVRRVCTCNNIDALSFNKCV